MLSNPPYEPFDLHELHLDVEVEADRYEESLIHWETLNPEPLEAEDLPF